MSVEQVRKNLSLYFTAPQVEAIIEAILELTTEEEY
jgi:hypothetical protein